MIAKAEKMAMLIAEILGLAATGVALAAEADRQDRKGKRRADLMVVKEPRTDRSRRPTKDVCRAHLLSLTKEMTIG